MTRRPQCVLAALVLVAMPIASQAQILAGSARAAGMADAYGTVARGVSAVFYNPANLGLRGNPKFGVSLPTASATYGTAPIALRDIKDYGGIVVPDSVKQEWLARIPAGGAFNANALANLNGFGLSAGPIAVAIGTIGDMQMALPRAAAELFLFGNAGASGTPTDQSLTGGSAHGFAASFAAASFGIPLIKVGKGETRQALAIGVTGKYIVGHAMGSLWEIGGTLTANPLTADLRFPAVTVFNDSSFFNSTGIGLDAGLVYQGPNVTLGATVSDVTNSFAWASADARVRDGRAALSVDSTSGSFTEYTLNDPLLDPSLAATARASLAAAVFKPAYRLSASWKAAKGVLVSTDYLHRTAKAANLQAGPANTVSTGFEWRIIPVLPLRAGAAVMTGGRLWTVGSGLEFGAFNINVAYGRRTGTIGAATLLAVGVGIGAGR